MKSRHRRHKKHTLRFHSYRIGTKSGKLTIYAEYDLENPPTVFDGYPSRQELLIELCNLNPELRGKSPEECARVPIQWSIENIHPCYFYGTSVSHPEWNKDDPASYWDVKINAPECYYVHAEEMVRDLEQLYTDTMTTVAIRSLMEGKVADAQRIYENVRVLEQENLFREWCRTDDTHRPAMLQRFVEKIVKLNMGLEYDLTTRQVQLQPVVKSVVDADYFGLARFMAVNANALDDYGDKANIAFCQACCKAFIKRSNRQKYCGTLECQSVRNKLKSKEYYYREKARVKRNKCYCVLPQGGIQISTPFHRKTGAGVHENFCGICKGEYP